MKKPIITTALMLGITGLGISQAQAATTNSYPWPSYSVVPILFSPTDWNINSDEVQEEAAALKEAMLDIQQFYGEALGGNTFTLNPLEVVQGDFAKESYGIQWNGGNIYTDGVDIVGNVEAAVVEELYSRGYPTPPGQNEDGYTVLIFVKGAGGWAGGRELGSGDGGWAILGDWAIDSIQGSVPAGQYWWSGKEQQIGAAAHELGHAFGLPHPDHYGGDWSTTVMGYWWNYPNVSLNQWEIDNLQTNKSPFFQNNVSVPEPLTIFGAGTAVAFGFGFKRKLAKVKKE